MEKIALSSTMTWILASSMIGYVLVMFIISYIAQKRIANVDDYVVAGRRLPLMLASATLLATWFGAGTLLTATDKVREDGVTGATLDPIGAGFCLLFVGIFFAAPLWRMKLRTLPDFFRIRFDVRSEVTASILMIPPYMGWIAAQFMALGGMLHLFFGIPLNVGVAIVALVGVGYTLMGGMWAVTLTDALQVLILIIGLTIMSIVILHTLGIGDLSAGWQRLMSQPPDRLQLIPTASVAAFAGWLSVFCAGSLGNIPSQDVMQRVFSSRSSNVARNACIIAGVLYLLIGMMPILVGLAAPLLLPSDSKTATLPLLAKLFMHPALAIVMILTIMSAVLSTIDSAILAPATVLAQNLLKRSPKLQKIDELVLNRITVLIIGFASLGVAYLGQSAYSLLESGYELGMVSLMAPLALGMWLKRRSNIGIISSMWVGTIVWMLHQALSIKYFFGISSAKLPVGLMSMFLSFAIYFMVAPFFPNKTPPDNT
jgi:Na+/proline symporter